MAKFHCITTFDLLCSRDDSEEAACQSSTRDKTAAGGGITVKTLFSLS